MKDMTDSLRRYLNDIGSIPLLEPNEERRLGKLATKGDQGAVDHLAGSNLRLVVTIARDYEGYGVGIEDLVAEGNIGLVTAAKRFDPTKGAKFSTYAGFWIRQAIRRAIDNQRSSIRIPVHLGEKVRLLKRVEVLIEEELHRPPTLDDVSETVGISRERLSELKTAGMRPTSLDLSIGEDGEDSMESILPDERAETAAESIGAREIIELMSECVSDDLTDRERTIIQLRFGLGGGTRQTLEDIGTQFGISRERVRQVQNIALEKLREGMRQRDSGTPAIKARGRDLAHCN
ncbi:MAG: RNA polymerase primary sigma factor [Verrucomicrobiales bacterium]|jgi:RNA polymerase primary sigma factor